MCKHYCKRTLWHQVDLNTDSMKVSTWLVEVIDLLLILRNKLTETIYTSKVPALINNAINFNFLTFLYGQKPENLAARRNQLYLGMVTSTVTDDELNDSRNVLWNKVITTSQNRYIMNGKPVSQKKKCMMPSENYSQYYTKEFSRNTTLSIILDSLIHLKHPKC